MSDTTTQTMTPADHYLAEVRRHLGALPDDERDDLLEDLDAHIHEVAAKDDRPLEEVLGRPEDFAAELIASAGLAPEAGEGNGATARAWDAMQARVAAGRAHPWTRAVVDFLPELRPAWWVARGWLVIYGLSLVTGEHADSFPVPILGRWIVGLAATVAAIVVSVRLGRRPHRPRWLWLVNGFAILVALVLPGAVNDAGHNFVDPNPAYIVGTGQLARPDGGSITSIYAYDAHGRPVRVRLYDQDGQPIVPGGDVVGPDGGAPLTAMPPTTAADPEADPGAGTGTVPPTGKPGS